jgi:hypothetical protein
VSTRDLDSPPPPADELPPFVFVPEAGGSTAWSERPAATEPPPPGAPAPRRWSTGHTVAAAVVAVGVLASGGVAWAARDSTGASTGTPAVGPGGQLPGGFGQQPGGRGGVGQQPGPLGGPGQLPGQPPGTLPGQAPDGSPDDSLAPDDDGVDT